MAAQLQKGSFPNPQQCQRCYQNIESGEAAYFHSFENPKRCNKQVWHIFHSICVTLNEAQHQTCPICRLQKYEIIHEVIFHGLNEWKFINAAKIGDVATVSWSLKNITILQNDMGAALIGAAKKGHLPIVEELLKQAAYISKEDRKKAIVEAQNHGYLPIVEELSKNPI